MPTNHFNVIIVMAIGSKETPDQITDSLDAIRCYADPSHRIVLANNRADGMPLPGGSDVDEVRASGPEGLGGPLYLILSKGMAHAIDRYDFDVMLKIDVDSLFIGRGAEQAAIDLFQREPGIGMAGSHRVDCTGAARDISWNIQFLKRETSWRTIAREPRLWRYRMMLRHLLRQAQRHGHTPGESCQGGGYFLSRDCARALAQQHLLGRHELQPCPLAEDKIFSLLACAAGFQLGDLSTGDLPLGIRWRGLPFAPAELAERGKRIIHSVRFFEEMTEPEIRRYFRERRANS